MDYMPTAPKLMTHKPKPSRQGTSARGYGHHWQRVRKIKIQKSPFCEMKLDGCLGFADSVHHRDADTSNNTASNLMSVCSSCHRKHHRAA